MTRRYLGREETYSTTQVARYLTDNYTHEDGSPVTEAEAQNAVQDHKQAVTDAIRKTSYAYYPGDRIAETMGWTELPEPDEEEDEDDE